MPYGFPIYQKSWSKLYDPLRGRGVLGEHRGFFTKAARLLYNNPVKMRYDGHVVLSSFIDRYNGIHKEDIKFITHNGKNAISIGQGTGDIYECIKHNNAYYIIPKNNNYSDSKIPLKINAQNPDILIEKLNGIFNSPIVRSKLELKTQKIPFLHLHTFDPGHGRYVFLNDNKMIANRYPQEFETSNAYAISNVFDTALGGVSAIQTSHYRTDDDLGAYSTKAYNKPYITVQDDTWTRLHSITEHLLSSNIAKGLIGNLVNMHSPKNNLSSQKHDITTQELLDEFVYNIHGKGTMNTRKRGESPSLHAYDIKDKSIFNQFEFGANPFRGGRFYRDLPLSLEQTILAFYSPQFDGKRVCKYDLDPEKFIAEMQKFKIIPADRQFIATHSRKILGCYVILRLLQDELANTSLDPKQLSHEQLTYNIKKWKDLNQIQDTLFESTKDLRDFLRLSVGSYGQLKDCVKKAIPDFTKNNNAEIINNASKDKQSFNNYTMGNIFNFIKGHTYLENIFGWHAREQIGSMIYDTLTKAPYNRQNISKARASTAMVVLLEGMENLSRQLKFTDDGIAKATNAQGSLQHLISRIQYGDFEGVKEFWDWSKNRLLHGFQGEKLFPDLKKQALQAEGIIMEKDYCPPPVRKYLDGNQNFTYGSTPINHISHQYGKKLAKTFTDYIQLNGIFLQKIRDEMDRKGIQDAYQTHAMKEMDTTLRYTAQNMAQAYTQSNPKLYDALKTRNPQDYAQIEFELAKKFYHYLQICMNASALLANAPDVVYKHQ